MAKYTYPNNDLNSASKLLSVVGSYWATTYLGMDFISDTLKAKSNLTAQTWVNFMELIASISRFTVPVFHHENWYPVVVKESEVNNFDSLIADYERGTTNVYDLSGDLNYGDPAPLKNYFSQKAFLVAIQRPMLHAQRRHLPTNLHASAAQNPSALWYRHVLDRS